MSLTHLQTIFYLPFANSGSGFFMSLFDEHPQILMIPSIFKVYQIYRKTRSYSPDHIVDYIMSEENGCLGDIFDRRKTVENGDFSQFNISHEIFRKEFKKLWPNSSQTVNAFVDAAHYAYAKAIHKNLEPVKWIFIHQHRIGSVSQMFQDYPQAKFITTIRNPKAGFHSQFSKHKAYEVHRLGYDFCWLNSALHIDFRHLLRSLETLKRDRFLVVKIEDVLNDFENIMKRIALEFDIEFLPSLLTPTLGGAPYVSSSPLNKKVYGPSKKLLEPKYKKDLSKEDILYLETYTKWYMQRYNYVFESAADMTKSAMLQYQMLAKNRFQKYTLVYQSWHARWELATALENDENTAMRFNLRWYLVKCLDALGIFSLLIIALTIKTMVHSIKKDWSRRKRLKRNIRSIHHDNEMKHKVVRSPHLL